MAAKSAPKTAAGKKSGPRPVFVVTRKSLPLWAGIGFLAFGLMFFAGVMVGRNTMPVGFDIKELERKLADIRQSVLISKIEPIDAVESIKEGGIPEIEESEKRILKPEHVKKEPAAEPVAPDELRSHENGRDNVQERESAPDTGKTDSEKAGSREQTGTKKTTRAEESESHAVKVSERTFKGYAIQVASLKNPESAGTARERFYEKGYPAYCQKAEIDGNMFYRVRIGPYSSRQEAEKDLKNLNDAGVDAIIFRIRGSGEQRAQERKK